MQSGIYDKFVAKAAEIAKKRTVGNPYEDVQQGPQVNYTYKDKQKIYSRFLTLDPGDLQAGNLKQYDVVIYWKRLYAYRHITTPMNSLSHRCGAQLAADYYD